MNKIFSTIVIFVAALGITGCENYDSDFTPQYSSVVRIDKSGEQTVKVAKTGLTQYDMVLKRSGYDISAPTQAMINVMTDEEWTRYSTSYDMTSYQRISSDCYSFADGISSDGAQIVRFKGKEEMSSLAIDFDGVKLMALKNKLGESAVICLPLKVTETSTGSVLSEKQNVVLVVKLTDSI